MRSSISATSSRRALASAVRTVARSNADETSAMGGAGVEPMGSAPAFTATSVLGHLDPALAHRVHHGLGPVVDGQLAQDRAHVVLDGLLADRQRVGDLLVGHALGDVVEDLDFTR